MFLFQQITLKGVVHDAHYLRSTSFGVDSLFIYSNSMATEASRSLPLYPQTERPLLCCRLYDFWIPEANFLKYLSKYFLKRLHSYMQIANQCTSLSELIYIYSVKQFLFIIYSHCWEFVKGKNIYRQSCSGLPFWYSFVSSPSLPGCNINTDFVEDRTTSLCFEFHLFL